MFYVLGVWQALVIGGLFIAAFVGSVAEEGRRMQDALNAAQVALEHEQRLSSLGGLAAAAAHELGTPLSTIAVHRKGAEPRSEIRRPDVRRCRTDPGADRPLPRDP